MKDIEALQDQAKKFAESGGDLALFWAGKMSLFIRLLENCGFEDLSETFMILNFCRIKYDTIILEREMEKD